MEELSLELEALRSSSARQSIESEQALHELNVKLHETEARVTQIQAEVEVVQSRESKQIQRTLELESQLQQVQQQSSDQHGNGEAIRVLQEASAKEKREFLLILERAEQDKVSLQESLDSLRGLHNSLQTTHSNLEATHLETATTARTSLLRIQTLTSTITSLESDKKFALSELETSRSEATRYRQVKHTEISKLQAELEIKTVEGSGAVTTLSKLKKVHDNLVGRHEELNAVLASTKEELSVSTGQFTSEMGSMRRLVETLEAREVERKNRLQQIESSLESQSSDKATRESELVEELQLERERFDALEIKFSEMREALEQFSAPVHADSVQSPRSSISNGFALSPSAQMAVRKQKTGKSYAEVYVEYVRMQEELALERAETKRLGECLTQILTDIEERAPLLKEQRLEYDRISTEATHLAASLASTLTDRDDQALQLENYQLNLDRLQRDNTIAVAQLRDLGRQVRSLARAIAAKEIPGIETRSKPNEDHDEEEEVIKKRATESNDTDAVVSAHLVTFSTINELQVQNQKLLRITREMGAQMESGEDAILSKRRGEENAAVQEAHELILRLKEEVESQRTKMETFIRERDMFRRMVTQRSDNGNNVTRALIGNGESTENGDGGRSLADVQSNFDAYRTEIAVDSQRLREDLSQALKDVNIARTDLAKTKAQSEFLSERFRLLNESYDLQSGEILQMSKRTMSLQQAIAKQDDSSHKMTEDLISLRSSSDQLRHENANYLTEREVWKSVENRLIAENTSLSKERSHLADLMRNLQSLQNELERAGTDSRRRLEEQVNRFETQSVELRQQLSQETENARQLVLRREIEGKNYQDRIDRLTTEFSSTRELLIAAKTSQEHLERRVIDLVSQVTAKEEKLAVYEGRTTSDSSDPNLTAEQQLEIGVVALKNELRVLQTKLDQANANVQQFQYISTTQGESLTELHSTYDDYKKSTDATLAEKEVEISSLRERLHSLTSEITTSNTENSELHRQLELERTNFEKERKSLSDDVTNVKLSETIARDAQLAAQEDVRRQAQIAREAHEKYERELVAHAEDVKRLTEIKDELQGLKNQIAGLESTAEVAKANLTGSEESWSRQKSILEQEISDLRKRCDDLNSQNVVLHEHLETFSSQAAEIQAQGSIEASTSSSSLSESTSTESATQLREVIRYLRREKEIVDLQLEFGKQEAARLRQQLEFATRNLEESRQSLVEERQRAGENAVSSTQHEELLERIHTAQLLRESNSTLRDENERNLKKVAVLDTKLRQATLELDPLREQVQTLQAVVESKESHLKLVEEDNERWKNRNQQILAKYERIDPEELQVLKDETEKFKSLLAESESKNVVGEEALAEQVKLSESMRSNWNNSTERFKNLQTQARITRAEHVELTKEVLELKTKLEAASTGSTEISSNNISEAQVDLQAEKDRLLALTTTLELQKQKLESELRQEITAREAAIVTLESEKAALAAEKTAIALELSTKTKRSDQLYVDNKKMFIAAREQSDAMSKLQKDFEEKNIEAIEAAVRVKLALLPSPTPLSDSTIDETVRERVAIAEIALTATREVAIAKAVEDATSQLRLDLVTAQAQLSASTSTGSTTADSSAFEIARKAMVEEFDKVKATLAAEAKARELEITNRLTEEIKKAASTKSTPAEIDALVKARLVILEAERLATQQTLIATAVAKALEARSAEHQVELANAKVNAEKEASLKNKMLVLQLNKQKNQLAEAKANASSPAIASTSTLPPLVSNISASVNPAGNLPIRGAVVNRGGVPPRGRPQVKGGLASRVTAAPTTTAPAANIRGAAGIAPVLSLKGAASPGAAGRGGVLNRVLASNAAANYALASTPPKRARDEEDADAAKRLKQQDPLP